MGKEAENTNIYRENLYKIGKILHFIVKFTILGKIKIGKKLKNY